MDKAGSRFLGVRLPGPAIAEPVSAARDAWPRRHGASCKASLSFKAGAWPLALRPAIALHGCTTILPPGSRPVRLGHRAEEEKMTKTAWLGRRIRHALALYGWIVPDLFAGLCIVGLVALMVIGLGGG